MEGTSSHQILNLEFLKLQNPLGVYVIPAKDNIYTWNGIIFLHQGPFRNGIFRFNMEMNSNYPCSKPVVRWITPLFHPRVDPNTGKMDLSDVEWNESDSHTWDILKGLKNALIWDCKDYCTGKVFNQEAADLWKSDSQKQKIRAFATVSKALDHLYDKYDSRIQF